MINKLQYQKRLNNSETFMFSVLDQWSPTLGLEMFLEFNSQKSWPAEVVVKASGSCSLRTSRGPRLDTTGLKLPFPLQVPRLRRDPFKNCRWDRKL